MVHGFLKLLDINYAAVDTPTGLCHCGDDTLTRALVTQFSNNVDELFFMIRSWSDHVTKLR
jgi:hypothetical protein